MPTKKTTASTPLRGKKSCRVHDIIVPLSKTSAARDPIVPLITNEDDALRAHDPITPLKPRKP